LQFPLDPRPLRDKLTASNDESGGRGSRRADTPPAIIDHNNIVEAEIVETRKPQRVADIVFIE
jgi:hypothetical protein